MDIENTVSASWHGQQLRLHCRLVVGTTDAEDLRAGDPVSSLDASALEPIPADLRDAQLPAAIAHRKDVADDEPILAGTRIRVCVLYAMHTRAGMSVEEIVREYPHLSARQIASAIEYAQANRDAMEVLLREDEEQD